MIRRGKPRRPSSNSLPGDFCDSCALASCSCCCWTSSSLAWVFFSCRMRWSLRPKRCVQKLHWNSLFPVCTTSCRLRSLEVGNRLGHWLHANLFSPTSLCGRLDGVDPPELLTPPAAAASDSSPPLSFRAFIRLKLLLLLLLLLSSCRLGSCLVAAALAWVPHEMQSDLPSRFSLRVKSPA